MQDIFIEEIARAGLAAETFDPADSVAEEVCVGCEKNGNGTARFILSKDSAVFRDTLSRIFVGSPMIEIRDVSVILCYTNAKPLWIIRSISKEKKVTMLGLGLLGRGVNVARFLAECGAILTITDLKTEKELAPSIKQLKKI